MQHYIGSPPFQWQGEINQESEQLRGLVAWWPIRSGNKMIDLISGNVASPAKSSGTEFGDALYFNGSSDYSTSPRHGSFEPASISVSVWIRYMAGGANQSILTKDYTSFASPYYSYSLLLSGSNGAACQAVWAVPVGAYSTADWIGSGATSIAAGAWTHLVGTYDGTTMRVYINGIEKGNKTNAGAITYYATDLHIGRERNYSTGTYFSGNMADLRIYNYAIGGNAVAQIYNPSTRWQLYAMPRPMAWWIPPMTTSIIPLVRQHMAQQGMA